jgi:hypothetical protein
MPVGSVKQAGRPESSWSPQNEETSIRLPVTYKFEVKVHRVCYPRVIHGQDNAFRGGLRASS